jgi:hypothetical protein
VRFVDPDGMWPDLGDALNRVFNTARNYVARQVTTAVNNVARATVNSVKNTASRLDVTPYFSAEAKVTGGARIAGEVHKAVGVDVNAQSIDLVSTKLEINKNGLKDSDANYAGKDGTKVMSQGILQVMWKQADQPLTKVLEIPKPMKW